MTPRQQRAYQALQLGPVWQERSALDRSLVTAAAGLAAVPLAGLIDATPVGDLPIEPARDAEVATLDWQTLAARVSQCQRCGLCQSRKQTVFGVGPRDARLMVVGEAPGRDEDAIGEPFVGQAGKLLDNMLAAIGLNRAQHVFIANVLKCRPPDNRNPEPAEVAACAPYLDRQIALLAPDLIVVMGRFAAHTLLRTEASIASLRGRVHDYRLGERAIPLVVTYHPAYLLRNLPDKAKAWSDLLVASALLK